MELYTKDDILIFKKFLKERREVISILNLVEEDKTLVRLLKARKADKDIYDFEYGVATYTMRLNEREICDGFDIYSGDNLGLDQLSCGATLNCIKEIISEYEEAEPGYTLTFSIKKNKNGGN